MVQYKTPAKSRKHLGLFREALEFMSLLKS